MYTYVPPINNKAVKIKIDDVDNNFQSDDVEGALKELAENGGSGSGHIHSNKAILDTITQEKIDSWDDVNDKADKTEVLLSSKLNDSGTGADELWSASKVNAQFNTIAKKTSVENGKLYLLKEDGTKIDTGTTLPSTEGVSYTLPIATATTLGGIKVGAGLSITSGVLSANGGGSPANEWGLIADITTTEEIVTISNTNLDLTEFLVTIETLTDSKGSSVEIKLNNAIMFSNLKFPTYDTPGKAKYACFYIKVNELFTIMLSNNLSEVRNSSSSNFGFNNNINKISSIDISSWSANFLIGTKVKIYKKS